MTDIVCVGLEPGFRHTVVAHIDECVVYGICRIIEQFRIDNRAVMVEIGEIDRGGCRIAVYVNPRIVRQCLGNNVDVFERGSHCADARCVECESIISGVLDLKTDICYFLIIRYTSCHQIAVYLCSIHRNIDRTWISIICGIGKAAQFKQQIIVSSDQIQCLGD